MLCLPHPPGFAGELEASAAAGTGNEGDPEPAATPEARTRARPMGLARGWTGPTLQARPARASRESCTAPRFPEPGLHECPRRPLAGELALALVR